MRKGVIAGAVASAVLLSGCVSLSGPRPGSELVGRTLRLVPERGQPSSLYFERDGTVRSHFGQRTATGRWWARNRRLCFLWGQNFRECWPYAGPFRRGATVPIRSDRGNRVRVTLL